MPMFQRNTSLYQVNRSSRTEMRRCASKVQVDGKSKTQYRRLTRSAAEVDTMDNCCGLIISSRAIFWSVTKARSGQNTEGVLGVTDGTYRLHFEFELGGWTIVYFGTYTTYYDKKQYAKTFVPRAYMFVRTEHQVAYATMFTTSVHRQRLHINCVFSHQGAFEMIMWPQEKAEYAQWFEDTYLASPWASWYYQGATPDVTPSQNALESHHKTIKTTILFHDALKPFRGKLYHFSEGPLCSGAVGRAKQLLDNKKNYYTLKAPKPRAVLGVLFDGTKFLISCRNINGSAPTRGRAQPYLKSLGGPTLQYSSLSFDPPNQISPRELSRKIHPVGLDPVDSR
ncbi:hypothetical protein PC120_g12043 [Phytophthora cactorum]|nr:hypothetical protein PC120_g12043 [Phytophthora cactorum]